VDAIIIRGRRDARVTLSIEEYEVQARDTSFGPEEITRD